MEGRKEGKAAPIVNWRDKEVDNSLTANLASFSRSSISMSLSYSSISVSLTISSSSSSSTSSSSKC